MSLRCYCSCWRERSISKGSWRGKEKVITFSTSPVCFWCSFKQETQRLPWEMLLSCRQPDLIPQEWAGKSWMAEVAPQEEGVELSWPTASPRWDEGQEPGISSGGIPGCLPRKSKGQEQSWKGHTLQSPALISTCPGLSVAGSYRIQHLWGQGHMWPQLPAPEFTL